MYDCIAMLVSKTISVSASGDSIETVASAKEVFCRVVGCDHKEKALADERGLTADLTFILSDMNDYNDERYIRYSGKEYRIIDTKWADGSLEIRLVGQKWQTV